jgi:acrylyl-CoA reductase (NADPH)
MRAQWRLAADRQEETEAMYQALWLEKDDAGFRASVRAIDAGPALADGEVRVAVAYSTLNYKDGLALTNRSPVVRLWPMVPGIDGAGRVIESRHAKWRVGDAVVHTGWGVGETRWGCLAGEAVLPGDALVRLPPSLDARQAMAIGTAGFTAMLSVLALEQHGVKPTGGEVLVTGASGGVGSVAVAVLARLGYRVVASTGKLAEGDYLKRLGAAELIDRATLAAPGKPMQKERWAAVVDSVGSNTLANACAQTRYGGVVAACGLAQGMDFPSSVAPFILRGVTLAGIESVMAPLARREAAWQRLAANLDPALLASMTQEIGLADAIARAADLMEGKVRGRIVVRTSA